MKKLYFNYLSTFKGLSKEVWWLALITLINRAGTMVIPFLSLYLNKHLSFSLNQIAWIMSCFGLGSVVGSWLGGKLTDKIGFYKVMKTSLFLTGILFISLQFVNSFAGVCAGIFLVILVADTFRPAMFVALSAYSKPENKTRSVTLIRLAINLGFSAGPAVGGIIITTLSYAGLFWVDGITCILATFLLINVLHPKKSRVVDEVKNENPVSIFKDKAFWIFFFSMIMFGVVFLQFLSTLPLFYKDAHHLTEFQIGLLMGLNGIIIVVLEMPLISWLEKSKFSKEILMFFGLFLTGLSFVVLNLASWTEILIISMILATIGEMIAFPFSNAFVLERAKKGNQGEYMAYYSISFSVSHIFAHNFGMQFVDKLGFVDTWNIMILLSTIGMVLILILVKIIKREKNEFKPSNATFN